MLSRVSRLFLLALGVASLGIADDQEKFDVNSPLKVLSACQLYGLDKPNAATIDPAHFPDLSGPTINKQPIYDSGTLDHTNAKTLVSRLLTPKCQSATAAEPMAGAPAGGGKVDTSGQPSRTASVSDDQRVVIFHLLRWGDKDHKTVQFQNWFVYDPTGNRFAAFDLASAQMQFERALIRGRKDFRFIYVHINFDLNNPSESIQPNVNSGEPELVHPIAYSINTQKQKTQLAKDAASLLSILGYTAAAAAAATNPDIGYYSLFDFSSKYNTSTITVTATLKQDKQAGQANAATATTANDIASRIYTNERPARFGLSFALPLTSYRDLTFDQSNSLLQPKTITRQNVYAAFNVYWPPVDPGFTSFRWVPHPFVAVPIKGQPLRNTMVGVAVGMRWLEPFFGVVFDRQQLVQANQPVDHLVRKGVWGLNISVDSVVKALKSSSTSSGTSPSSSASSSKAKKSGS
jgi:hypothetical protein